MKCLAKKRPLFCGLGCPRFSFHPMARLSTGGKNQRISDRVQRHSKHCGVARSHQNYFRCTESRKCLKGHKGPVKNPSFLHLLLLLTLPMPKTTMQLHPFSFKATLFFFFLFAVQRNLEFALETVVGRGYNRRSRNAGKTKAALLPAIWVDKGMKSYTSQGFTNPVKIWLLGTGERWD